MFVAFDLSAPVADAFDTVDENTAVKVFSSLSRMLQNADDGADELVEVKTNYFTNILLPFIIYLLTCGGFIFLILENIRLWKMMNLVKPVSKLMWTIWIILLGLMSLLPIYLGTSLVFEGIWYIFVVIAVISLFYWMYWVSKN